MRFLRRFFILGFIACLFFLSFAGKHIFAAPGTSSFVGYWKLDETTQGADAVDSSGYGNTGFAHGTGSGPAPSTDVTYTTFPDSHSSSFNGLDQYFEIPSSSNLNPTSAVTISAWIKLAATDSSYHTIAGKWDVGTLQAYLIQINNNGKLGFWTGNGTTCADLLESTNTIPAGSWVHIVGVQNGTNKILYINGSQNNTKTSSCSLGASSGNFTIGSKHNVSSVYFEFFNGNIDEVRVYTRALSTGEVADLARGNQTTAVWTGNSSTNFETAGNWDINAIPEPFTKFTIGVANPAILSANEQFSGLIVNSGSLFDLAGFNLTMNSKSATSGLATGSGTIVSKNSETLTNFILPTTGTAMYNNTSNATGLLFGNSYNHLIFNDGLVAYWKLDETTAGSTVIDSSGYINSGTPIGSGGGNNKPQPSTNISPVNFLDNRSLSFDGTDDYVDCGTTPHYLPSGNSARTIAAWVYGNSFADDYGKTVVGWGQDEGGKLSELEVNGSSSHIEFHGNGNDIQGSTVLQPNRWYHLAATITSGGVVKLYVNGVQDGTGSVSLNTTEANCKIGRQPDFNGQYFNGFIDDVRIYNRVLLVSEISALATGNEPGTTLATTTLNNALMVDGNFILNSGSLDISTGNYEVAVAGDFENNGGYFNARSGAVTLNGTSQTINSGNSFFNLTKSVSSADTLTFGQNSISTTSGTMTLTGVSGNLLSLRSSTDETAFKIDPQGTRDIDYVNVQDSNNINETEIAYSANNTYGDNLTNWVTSGPTPTPTSAPTPTPTVGPTTVPSDNSSGGSGSASAPSCSAVAPAGQPNLYQLDPSESSVTLYFTPVSGADSYYISYGTTGSANQFATNFSNSDASGAVAYSINNLQPGVTYYFEVRAGKGCATGNWSQIKSSTTLGISNSQNIISNVVDTVSEVIAPPKKAVIKSSDLTAEKSNVCSYTVRSGDSLWSIAADKLGEGVKYEDLKRLNNITGGLHPGVELKLPCDEKPETVAKAIEETKQAGVNLDVKVLGANNEPIAGVDVTIHSVVQKAKTDENGIASFKNVEPGEHKVLIAYQEYTGSQNLKVDGTKKTQELTMKVELTGGVSWPVFGVVIVIMGGIILYLLFLLKKKNNSKA